MPSLNHPTRTDVNEALHELEIAEARRKWRADQEYLRMHRPGMEVTGWALVKMFGWVLLSAAFLAWLIWRRMS